MFKIMVYRSEELTTKIESDNFSIDRIRGYIGQENMDVEIQIRNAIVTEIPDKNLEIKKQRFFTDNIKMMEYTVNLIEQGISFSVGSKGLTGQLVKILDKDFKEEDYK